MHNFRLKSQSKTRPYFTIKIMKKALVVAALFALANSAFAGDTAPVLEKNTCKVDYPRTSLMNEETGTVTFSLLVNENGTDEQTKLESSSGSRTLDSAALKGYATCKFKPGSKDGKSAQVWTKIQHVWSLS